MGLEELVTNGFTSSILQCYKDLVLRIEREKLSLIVESLANFI